MYCHGRSKYQLLSQASTWISNAICRGISSMFNGLRREVIARFFYILVELALYNMYFQYTMCIQHE